MPEFTVDWFEHQRRETEAVLAPFRDRPRLRMLEIGAYEGRSTLWFLEQVLTGEGSHLTTVDAWEGATPAEQAEMAAVYARFRHNTAPYVAAGRLTVVVSRSQPFLAAGVTSRLHLDPDDGYDAIYIDGSHAAADVLSDAVLSWALLKPGGTLVFDDYRWQAAPEESQRPRIAIDSFLACFMGQYDELQRGYQLAVRKRPLR